MKKNKNNSNTKKKEKLTLRSATLKLGGRGVQYRLTQAININ